MTFLLSQIDVLAASSLSGIANFEGYKGNRTYSPDLPVETIYVAASFESRQFLPTEFTLGTGQTVNGYLNGQLKSDMTYQCALRVYSAVNDSSFTISNTQTIGKIRNNGTNLPPNLRVSCSDVRCKRRRRSRYNSI